MCFSYMEHYCMVWKWAKQFLSSVMQRNDSHLHAFHVRESTTTFVFVPSPLVAVCWKMSNIVKTDLFRGNAFAIAELTLKGMNPKWVFLHRVACAPVVLLTRLENQLISIDSLSPSNYGRNFQSLSLLFSSRVRLLTKWICEDSFSNQFLAII